MDELGAIGFAGYLAFHNYNEPLLNPRIFDEIAYACAAAPGARPAIYSNGDVVDAAMFHRLIDAGVKYLRITRYPRSAASPPSLDALRRWLRRAHVSDIEWRYEKVRQGLAAVADVGACRVEVISPDIAATYNYRGGAVTTLPVLVRQRTEPCLMTATSAAIDYRGTMKMCCCVYPEAATHEGYVIGDLRVSGFLELWESARMDAYRQAHAVADWSLSPVCASCAQPLPETRRELHSMPPASVDASSVHNG